MLKFRRFVFSETCFLNLFVYKAEVKSNYSNVYVYSSTVFSTILRNWYFTWVFLFNATLYLFCTTFLLHHIYKTIVTG